MLSDIQPIKEVCTSVFVSKMQSCIVNVWLEKPATKSQNSQMVMSRWLRPSFIYSVWEAAQLTMFKLNTEQK